MKPLKLLLALPVVGAGIGMAAPALADSNDDTFLATLQAAGITYHSTDRAIAAGKAVCKMAGQGKPMVDVVKTVQSLNPAMHGDNAARFTAIAASVYCPQALSVPTAGG